MTKAYYDKDDDGAATPDPRPEDPDEPAEKGPTTPWGVGPNNN